MSDFITITVELPADRTERFRRNVKKFGGRVSSISGPAGAVAATNTVAAAERLMVADAKAFECRVLDALYDSPDHAGTSAELARILRVDEKRVLGAFGSLGAKLNRHLTGQRTRAMHIWLEETTSVAGEKIYRMRPEFVTNCGRWL